MGESTAHFHLKLRAFLIMLVATMLYPRHVCAILLHFHNIVQIRNYRRKTIIFIVSSQFSAQLCVALTNHWQTVV